MAADDGGGRDGERNREEMEWDGNVVSEQGFPSHAQTNQQTFMTCVFFHCRLC
jgi:hypothetical protein